MSTQSSGLSPDYEKIYTLLDDLTPIAADCGELCRRRCCKGGNGDGMLLFPGESEFLQGQRMLKVSQGELAGKPVGFAVCRGRCHREWRPLSCRIYPFAPVLGDGGVSVVFDPRAKYICPLAADTSYEYIQKDFLDAVKTAGELIAATPEGRQFLTDYTQMLEGYGRFTG